MMTNGFGCILGGIVSGKVVEMYTQNGITDWQTVWLIFAGYPWFWPSRSWRCSNINTFVSRQAHRRLATNYAKKNGSPEGDPFLFLLQHIPVQPFHAICIGFAIDTLQLRRKSRQQIHPFFQRKEITLNRPTPDFSGYHAKHARWIRQRPFCRNSPFGITNPHQLHFTANISAMRIPGFITTDGKLCWRNIAFVGL